MLDKSFKELPVKWCPVFIFANEKHAKTVAAEKQYGALSTHYQLFNQSEWPLC